MSGNDLPMGVVLEGDNVAMVWSNVGAQMLNMLAALAALICVSWICGTRAKQIKHTFTQWQPGSAVWTCKAFLFLSFISSFLFVVLSACFQYGIGLSHPAFCEGAIVLCISSYVVTKLCLYSFLVERIFITSRELSRFKSKTWMGGAALISLGGGVVVVATLGRTSHVSHDKQCHIGMHSWGTFTLFAWDLVLNLYLSSAFAIPLLRSEFDGRIKKLAKASLVVAAVSLVSTCSNFLVLGILGDELGWICLSSCTLDVCVNVGALACISHNDEQHPSTTQQPSETLPTSQRSGCKSPILLKSPIVFSKRKSKDRDLGGVSITREEMVSVDTHDDDYVAPSKGPRRGTIAFQELARNGWKERNEVTSYGSSVNEDVDLEARGVVSMHVLSMTNGTLEEVDEDSLDEKC